MDDEMRRPGQWDTETKIRLLEACGETVAAPQTRVLDRLHRKPITDRKGQFVEWGPPISRGASGDENVITILTYDTRWNGGEEKRIRFNSFARVVEMDGERREDTDEFKVHMWLFRYYDLSVASSRLAEIVTHVAHEHSYHPLRDHLAALAPWDGTERLRHLFSRYMGADETPLHSEYGIRWCISAVARACIPGAKADHVVILCGDQGCGKSTAIRNLAMRDEWFADSALDFRSKDSAQCLTGRWLWEMSELDSLRRSDQELAKGWLASQEDVYREPYQRHPTTVKRQNVFAGTSNQLEFLSDASGSRRYWVVQVGRGQLIDQAALIADRDQLWAEALHRFRAGELWHLSQAFERKREAAATQYETVDPWEIPIVEWLPSQTEPFTVYQVLVGSAIDIRPADISRGNAYRVASILQRLGCVKSDQRQMDDDQKKRQTWAKGRGYRA